jgi:HAD superfamily hydrolase (TIGR01509 family)
MAGGIVRTRTESQHRTLYSHSQRRPIPGCVRGVLFDVDGTLIDSNAAHAHAWVEALREHKIKVSFDEVRPLIGMGGDKLLPRLSGIEAKSRAGQAIGRRRRQLFLERYLSKLRAFPGSRTLVKHLRERGKRVYVATSAHDDELRPLLERAGVADLIEGTASSGDAERSKPDRDIVEAALRRSGLPAAQVVLIGDTPYDIEAATRSRVSAIGLRCGGWSAGALHGAVAVYENPADVLAHYGSSILARG